MIKVQDIETIPDYQVLAVPALTLEEVFMPEQPKVAEEMKKIEYEPLLLSLIGEVRSTIREKGHIVSVEAWQEALDLDLLMRLAKAGQWEKAKTFLLNELKAAKKRSRMKKRNFLQLQ